jgi:hypothetical protein
LCLCKNAIYAGLAVRGVLVKEPLEYGWSRTDENSGGVSFDPLRSSITHRIEPSKSPSLSATIQLVIAVRHEIQHVIGIGENGLDHPLCLFAAKLPIKLPQLVLHDVVTVANRQPCLLRPDDESHVGKHVCLTR